MLGTRYLLIFELNLAKSYWVVWEQEKISSGGIDASGNYDTFDVFWQRISASLKHILCDMMSVLDV